jgi:hypothetical protein
MSFWNRSKITIALGLVQFIMLFTTLGCNAADCPKFKGGKKVGEVQSPMIGEASGLAASRKNPGVLWLNNDDGPACVYAMTPEGKLLGVYNLEGAQLRDWEDIAIGPGPQPNVDYLYVGEIGDNFSKYKSIIIFRVPEPNVDANQNPAVMTLRDVETIELVYPDGPKNAETLLLDPLTKDIFVISKEGTSRVYRAAYPQSTKGTNKLELVTKLHWGNATGGDISPDGSEIIIRGYFGASIWARSKDGPMWKAFKGSECSIPIVLERQGEAICFDAKGTGYYTTSEHRHQPIYYYSREADR